MVAGFHASDGESVLMESPGQIMLLDNKQPISYNEMSHLRVYSYFGKKVILYHIISPICVSVKMTAYPVTVMKIVVRMKMETNRYLSLLLKGLRYQKVGQMLRHKESLHCIGRATDQP